MIHKKTLPLILLIFIAITTHSCQNYQDELELNNIDNNQPEAIVEKTVENGGFVFSSKESLKTTIENFEKDEMENVEKEFEKLYQKGFRSELDYNNAENCNGNCN